MQYPLWQSPGTLQKVTDAYSLQMYLAVVSQPKTSWGLFTKCREQEPEISCHPHTQAISSLGAMAHFYVHIYIPPCFVPLKNLASTECYLLIGQICTLILISALPSFLFAKLQNLSISPHHRNIKSIVFIVQDKNWECWLDSFREHMQSKKAHR